MGLLVIQTATYAAVRYWFSFMYFESIMTQLRTISLYVRLSESPLIGKPAYTANSLISITSK